MTKIFKLFLLCALLLGSLSCASSLQRKVSIVECKKFELVGFSAVKTEITISNRSRRTIELPSAQIVLKNGGSPVATLTLKEPIVVAKRTDSVQVASVWRLSDLDALSALSAVKKIVGGQSDSFVVDVDFRIKAGAAKRTVSQDNIPLQSLINLINTQK